MTIARPTPKEEVSAGGSHDGAGGASEEFHGEGFAESLCRGVAQVAIGGKRSCTERIRRRLVVGKGTSYVAKL